MVIKETNDYLVQNKKKPGSFYYISYLRWCRSGTKLTYPQGLKKKIPYGRKIWNVPESLHYVTWTVHKGHIFRAGESEGQSFPGELSACSTETGWPEMQAPLGVSCCHFHSIFYTPPAFLHLFFVICFSCQFLFRAVYFGYLELKHTYSIAVSEFLLITLLIKFFSLHDTIIIKLTAHIWTRLLFQLIGRYIDTYVCVYSFIE